MLFSEPKIPQSTCRRRYVLTKRSFSALQRAENSSIRLSNRPPATLRMFQCSSASRKFLNPDVNQKCSLLSTVSVLFSEPKIPQSNRSQSTMRRLIVFQCSSASRKFLNYLFCFCGALVLNVSVLFSEPKIPQSCSSRRARRCFRGFSALQRAENSSIKYVECCYYRECNSFSALQRAENSSIINI